MYAAVEIGRNSVSKYQIQPEYGKWAGWRGAGRPNPSRETKFSGANGGWEKKKILVQLTTSRISNLCPIDPHSAIFDSHTYSSSPEWSSASFYVGMFGHQI